MLTTGVDTVPGSTGTELITGGSTALTTTDTLQASDQIDGGAGRDTANLSVTKNFAGFTVGTGFMKNVETVNLSNTTNTVTTFSAKGIEGVEAYNVSGPVSVTAIGSLSSRVNLSDLAAAAPATILVTYADEIVTGSADSATMGISGLGRASTTSDPYASTEITLTVAGIETVNLVGTSGANHVAIGAAAANKALTYAGSGSLVLETFGADSNIKTYDGSTASGAQTLQFTNATNMTSIKTGAGNDTIRVAAGEVRADATISGGDGTDTLQVVNTGGITAAWALEGIETLHIRGGATGNVVLSPSSVSGLKTIFVQEAAGGTHTISGLGANEITVDLRAVASDVASSLTVENTAAAKLAVSVGSATSEVTAIDSVEFTKATSVVVDLPLYSRYASTGVITATKATSVTVQGQGEFDHATDGLILPAATSLTLNQTRAGITWDVGVSAGASTTAPLTDLTVTAVGTVTLTTGATSSGAANAFANIERLTVTADNAFDGVAVPGALTKATSVVLAGSKDDSEILLGGLGSTTNAYGLTVKATGLKDGLTLGALAAGSGQTLTVDLTGKTGSDPTAIGTLSAGTAYNASTNPVLSGNVVLDAKGATATGNLVQTGAVYGANVTLDASGSSFGSKATDGTVDFGAITGNAITVKASSAPTLFTLGAIEVRDSFTYVGPAVAIANDAGNDTVAITAMASSTALTVSLTGGVGADKFTIAGGAAQSKITVSGDLKAGADALTITSTSGSSSGQTIDVSGLVSTNVVVVAGSRNDTIKGSAGNDTITAGAGADTIDISQGGDDTIILRSPVQDTGTVSIVASDGTPVALTDTVVLAANQYVSTSGLDKIVGFGAGDIIQANSIAGSTEASAATVLQKLGSARGTSDGATNVAIDGTTAVAANAAIDLFVQGNYDASANRFTFTTSGRDTLYLLDDNGSAGGTTMYGVVLVGYVLGGAAEAGAGTGLVGVGA